MTKRSLAWLALGSLMLASLSLGVFGLSGTRTVRIGEAEIQKRIDAQLPMSSSEWVTLTKATIQVKGGDVAVRLLLEGRALDQPFSLEASGIGVPEYRHNQQAFYFRPTKLAVTKLELLGESATDWGTMLLDRYITDPKLRKKIEENLPGVKKWIEDNLEPRALSLFATMPLYQPKNDIKGIVIKATLERLTVEDGAIVLSFSLLQLTKTVFLCMLAFLCAVATAFALLRNTEWGMPLVRLG